MRRKPLSTELLLVSKTHDGHHLAILVKPSIGMLDFLGPFLLLVVHREALLLLLLPVFLCARPPSSSSFLLLRRPPPPSLSALRADGGGDSFGAVPSLLHPFLPQSAGVGRWAHETKNARGGGGGGNAANNKSKSSKKTNNNKAVEQQDPQGQKRGLRCTRN